MQIRKIKKTVFLLSLFSMLLLGLNLGTALAQEERVDYGDKLIVDSDLDGLTDEGEKQLYNTDWQNPDSDGDGFLDGAEAVGKNNPSDPAEPKERVILKTSSHEVQGETPWAWYLARATALVSFFLLWLSIFLGVSMHLPAIGKITRTIFPPDAHYWISLQALFFALIHGWSLLFDKYIGFNFSNILIPFAKLPENAVSRIDPTALALGVVAFYLMTALVISSYLRKYVPHWLWRGIHFLNVGLYLGGVVHALRLGTDLQSGYLRTFFIWGNVFLAIFLFFGLFNRFVWRKIRKNTNADIRENNPESVQERNS